MNKLKTLPIHIRQIPRTKQFVDSKTGRKYTYKQALALAVTPEVAATKHEVIMEQRWDLRAD